MFKHFVVNEVYGKRPYVFQSVLIDSVGAHTVVNYTREFILCSEPMNKKYRSYIEIIASMLEAVKYHRASQFSIMKYAGTNYSQLKKFLKSLIELDFVDVETEEGRDLYRANDKGLAFLRQYYGLQEMLLNSLPKKPDNVISLTEYEVSKVHHSGILLKRTVTNV